MLYESPWWRLSEAVTRVIEASAVTQDEVQINITRAIAGRTIKIQCKLGKRMGSDFGPGPVLEGKDFHLPERLNPEDFDWADSRPKNPWAVRRESFRPAGLWFLEWIELPGDDVMKLSCATQNRGKLAKPASSKPGPKSRTQPKFERASRAIRQLWPSRLPSQVELSNKELCQRVAKKLKDEGLGAVSDETILRAAGRRK